MEYSKKQNYCCLETRRLISQVATHVFQLFLFLISILTTLLVSLQLFLIFVVVQEKMNKSDHEWIQNILVTGTLSDKFSAHVLLIQVIRSSFCIFVCLCLQNNISDNYINE